MPVPQIVSVTPTRGKANVNNAGTRYVVVCNNARNGGSEMPIVKWANIPVSRIENLTNNGFDFFTENLQGLAGSRNGGWLFVSTSGGNTERDSSNFLYSDPILTRDLNNIYIAAWDEPGSFPLGDWILYITEGGTTTQIQGSAPDTVSGWRITTIDDGEINNTATCSVLVPLTASLTATYRLVFGSMTQTGRNYETRFTIVDQTPRVTGFTPSSGDVGIVVAIDIENFDSVTDIQFNNISVTTFALESPTRVNATVPATVTTGKIKVLGTKNGLAVNALSVNNFTVTVTTAPPAPSLPPTITNVSPLKAGVYTGFFIQGTNLNGATQVELQRPDLSWINAYQFNVQPGSTTYISVIMPAVGVNGLVRVTTPQGTATSTQSISNQPEITSLSPSSSLQVTWITIIGVNLYNYSQVVFGCDASGNGGVACLSTGGVRNQGTQVTALVPAGFNTGYVKIVTSSGSAISPMQFTRRPKPGLFAWYRFSETSGATTADSTGNGFNGNVNGGAVFQLGQPVWMGNHLALDGIDDSVSLGDVLDISGTAFTFFCWMRRSASGITHLIRRATTSSVQYAVRVNSLGKVEFEFGGVVIQSAATIPSDNFWRQVGVMYDGNVVKFIVDGVITTVNQVGTISTVVGAVTTFGSNAPQTGTIAYSAYKVDTIRIYDITIDDQTILDFYNSEKPPFQVPTTESILNLENTNIVILPIDSVLALETTFTQTGIATPSTLKAFIDAAPTAPPINPLAAVRGGQRLPRE